MPTQRARQRIQTLLATTVLIAAAGFGCAEAGAQQRTSLGAPAYDANAQAVSLDPIDVRGNAGGTVGYLATRTSTATKTNTPLRDVPQAVTVVTKEQIKDIGALKMEDNVENIFDTRYYPTADGNNNITPGSPRAARIAITANY